MKLAIYTRVSRRDLNPENQEQQLVEYCISKQYEYELFKEIESTRNTRPIKQTVLQLLREGRFNGVLIWKLDRWARSLQELITDIDEITSKNKEFIVLTQPIDTTNASGRLFLQILGAFAEFERELIRERTIAGLDRARKKGIKLGRPKGSKNKGGV
jgi:DNA invertase Pin-like site-specific DNA recombinase